ncbi:bidirectional sugar transporter SWEET5 [Diospyros lotus]|uniref:bidirectional sugar transporter SWEET5 n=1 Tax=Diospyros lotus TaxID=55363 RepID=UPI0022572F23|nr:bidirectional sugar transporter SWEET5 [Diospyros lotus]
MVDTDATRMIMGIVGNVISFFLFISPLPTIWKIFKSKSVQEFRPDPYVATTLNCAMWVFYGLPFIHPDNLLVLTINGAGLIIELIYVFVFLSFSAWPLRRKIIIALVIEAIFFVGLACITLTILHTTKTRSKLVGGFGVFFNIIMYISPLTVMRMVIKRKSVKYMPFYLAVANFANGSIWLAYALLKIDLFLAVPNGLGTLSGLIQLILYVIYYKTTKWEEEEEEDDGNNNNNNNEKPSEESPDDVQVQQTPPSTVPPAEIKQP